MVETFKKVKKSNLSQSQVTNAQKGMNLAASWYVAMSAKELKNKPTPIELFSQPLVAWRDQQGNPVIMERFCVHMGASLALGKVKDGCLQCPFHNWKFDSTGECVSIPDIDKIPVTARQKTYVSFERDGFIWVWYGTETPLFELPEFPPTESEQKNYMPLRYSLRLKTSVRRVMENPYDRAHLVALHKLKVAEWLKVNLLDSSNTEQYQDHQFGILVEAKLEGLQARVDTISKFLGLKPETTTIQVNNWPSGNTTSMLVNGKEAFQAMLFFCPISEGNIIAYTFYQVKKTNNLWQNLINYVFFGISNVIASREDVPIWNTIQEDVGVACVKTDRPILKFREYYQSWVNRVE